MDNSVEKYIGRLVELSNKKYRLLEEMFSLTKTQSDVITEESVERLQENIKEKQIRIDQIDQIDEEFNVYFQRMKQVTGVKNLEDIKGLNVSGFRELQDNVKQIMVKIKEIGDLEKSNSQMGKRLLEKFGEEIKKINQSKKVNLGYNPGAVMQPPSYYFDKKK